MAAPAGVDASTWAALLRWSMQQGADGDGTAEAGSSTKPMSEEDKDWLTKVMSEGLVDYVQKAGEISDSVRVRLAQGLVGVWWARNVHFCNSSIFSKRCCLYDLSCAEGCPRSPPARRRN